MVLLSYIRLHIFVVPAQARNCALTCGAFSGPLHVPRFEQFGKIISQVIDTLMLKNHYQWTDTTTFDLEIFFFV